VSVSASVGETKGEPHVDKIVAGTRLGDRYTLLRRIAAGGMAEIFVARQQALAGFEKDVVIKLLQEKYRHDARVNEMFLDEARIGAGLNHPNIVHVYDVGDFGGTPYIAMEYIQGEELSELCKRGLELGDFLPFSHAVDLVRQAAEGMGFYHAKRDEKGEPLEIVHRDISPSNLLVTSDGGLKIIDFGIARSRWSSSSGGRLMPGKANYMAPEQARGEKTDHRADIYALGIVLYELTVGRRLFKGKPEEVIDKVKRGEVKPPTFVRREFPTALEAIVMRALEPHAGDRYQNAYELASDLQEFLHESHLKSGPFRIAQYLDDLAHRAGQDRRPELIVAGEAWVDDEGEDALDFGRQFKDVKTQDVAGGPVAASGRPRRATPQPMRPPALVATGSGPKVEPSRPAFGPDDSVPTAIPYEPSSAKMVFPPPPEKSPPAANAPAVPVAAAAPHVAPAPFGQSIVEDGGKSPLPWVLLGAALATIVFLVLVALR
jgi:tRNA A-37 threonylcarbamoyl transferase component Bud32